MFCVPLLRFSAIPIFYVRARALITYCVCDEGYWNLPNLLFGWLGIPVCSSSTCHGKGKPEEAVKQTVHLTNNDLLHNAKVDVQHINPTTWPVRPIIALMVQGAISWPIRMLISELSWWDALPLHSMPKKRCIWYLLLTNPPQSFVQRSCCMNEHPDSWGSADSASFVSQSKARKAAVLSSNFNSTVDAQVTGNSW